MGKYKILAPIGGHQQKVWMPNEIAKDTDFRVPVADLVRDGFISLVEGSEDDVDVQEPVNDLGNEGGAPPDDEKEPVDSSNVEGSKESGEDLTTKEIKAQLDYEGIKYPANASKQELFQIYQNK